MGEKKIKWPFSICFYHFINSLVYFQSWIRMNSCSQSTHFFPAYSFRCHYLSVSVSVLLSPLGRHVPGTCYQTRGNKPRDRLTAQHKETKIVRLRAIERNNPIWWVHLRLTQYDTLKLEYMQAYLEFSINLNDNVSVQRTADVSTDILQRHRERAFYISWLFCMSCWAMGPTPKWLTEDRKEGHKPTIGKQPISPQHGSPGKAS